MAMAQKVMYTLALELTAARPAADAFAATVLESQPRPRRNAFCSPAELPFDAASARTQPVKTLRACNRLHSINNCQSAWH